MARNRVFTTGKTALGKIKLVIINHFKTQSEYEDDDAVYLLGLEGHCIYYVLLQKTS